MHDYAGSLHFHSDFSYDARVPVETIVTSALGAGLHFAVLTDHSNLDARAAGWERYHVAAANVEKRLLLIVGEEISPRYNHYLALGIDQPVVLSKMDMDVQGMIDAVAAQGGFGFVSHPDHSGAALVGARAYPWLAWEATGFAGIGIWDLQSDWSTQLGSRWEILLACLSPARALRGPRAETLARWDALNAKAPCAAIGEIDNHAARRHFLFFSRDVFSFDFAFRTIRTHILLSEALTGEAVVDRARILRALREGQSYVSLDYWHDPTGFRFDIFDATSRALPGGTHTLRSAALLDVKLPAPGRFRIVRNGHVIWEERSRAHVERDVDLPGVYRIEVDQHAAGRWRPWIFSNPIRVI